jgi:rRNA processing protein Gar1
VGTLEEVGRDGVAVAVCVTTPNIGDVVFDARGRKIGVVKRVFGPVDRPYASILLNQDAVAGGLANKEIYSRGTQDVKDKRRNRRD